MLPLESTPSPPASISSRPPEMVMTAFSSVSKASLPPPKPPMPPRKLSPPKLPRLPEPSLPPAALRASSEAVRSISPPEMSMVWASRPS